MCTLDSSSPSRPHAAVTTLHPGGRQAIGLATFMMPVLMGVQVKKGEQLPWYAITYEGRAKLAQLGKEIKTVADFGRSYKDICSGRGYYTLEDWISFIETSSDLLLRHEDILHADVS